MNRLPDTDFSKLAPEIARQFTGRNLNLFKTWAYVPTSTEVNDSAQRFFKESHQPDHVHPLHVVAFCDSFDTHCGRCSAASAASR